MFMFLRYVLTTIRLFNNQILKNKKTTITYLNSNINFPKKNEQYFIKYFYK